MKMTFRWYGEDDPITLDEIRQIPGMQGIVTAIYDIPVGEVWPLDRILKLKEKIESCGLELSVIESVPVHEDIKMGCGNRDLYIENYCTTLKNLSIAGIDCVCYNFMPVFDWTRSDLHHRLPDGSYALSYDEETVLKMNPQSGDLSLPGWDSSYTKDEMKSLLEAYSNISEADLWNNLKYFLEAIMPTCEECDVKMAIHPDDPPWGIFGLPRIITGKEAVEKLLNMVPSKYNGLTLCTGSLGASPDNDMVEIIKAAGNRIYFAHLRNVSINDRWFNETAHESDYGSLDMYEIVKALQEVGFDGYIRPDHGRMIWGEVARPGYGLYDRALGVSYLNGLWEAVEKSRKEK